MCDRSNHDVPVWPSPWSRLFPSRARCLSLRRCPAGRPRANALQVSPHPACCARLRWPQKRERFRKEVFDIIIAIGVVGRKCKPCHRSLSQSSMLSLVTTEAGPRFPLTLDATGLPSETSVGCGGGGFWESRSSCWSLKAASFVGGMDVCSKGTSASLGVEEILCLGRSFGAKSSNCTFWLVVKKVSVALVLRSCSLLSSRTSFGGK